jgi:pimeloyl-ACP methyl ester carboxylesterase
MIAGTGFLGIVFIAQRSMMYFPMREDSASLERVAASQGFEPWRNARGDTIGYIDRPNPLDARPPFAFLIFHGNAGHAAHRMSYGPILRAAAPSRAVTIHILEYPGYGARPGKPSQSAFLSAANEALARIPGDSPVILLGESIGTGVACATAAANPQRVSGLLLLTPFDSITNVARHNYPLLPVRWILRDPYPSPKWLESYKGPAVFVLAARDTIVPARLGQTLHDLYKGPKLLITVDDANHNELLSGLSPEAWKRAVDFLLETFS